jgi:hypothetical protein
VWDDVPGGAVSPVDIEFRGGPSDGLVVGLHEPVPPWLTVSVPVSGDQPDDPRKVRVEPGRYVLSDDLSRDGARIYHWEAVW